MRCAPSEEFQGSPAQTSWRPRNSNLPDLPTQHSLRSEGEGSTDEGSGADEFGGDEFGGDEGFGGEDDFGGNEDLGEGGDIVDEAGGGDLDF